MSKQSRARTQEMRRAREEAERRRKRRMQVVTVVGGAVVVALIAAIVLFAVRAATNDDSAAAGGGDTPANLSSDGGIPVGDADAPVTVDIYLDYMCPACGMFEKANGGELNRLVEVGTAQVELHPISFLDRFSSGTEYSTRAANAVATVADQAPDAVWAFNDALYANQPAEGSSGLSDDEIAEIATDAGVPDAVVDTFTDRRFEGWVVDSTKAAFDSGVEGTPTVRIDGEVFEGDLYNPGPLTAAIEAAAGDSGEE